MAGFTFLANMLPTAISLANSVQNARRQTQSYRQAEQDYAQKQQDLSAELAAQQQQIKIDADADSTSRRDALRRAMARQKAQFGGQGIDSSDGSAEAILLGLTQQSEAEQDQQDKLNQLRSQALQNNAATQSRKNLLALNQAKSNLPLASLFDD